LDEKKDYVVPLNPVGFRGFLMAVRLGKMYGQGGFDDKDFEG